MTGLPRDRVGTGHATPEQFAAGERWAERRRRRHLHPGTDRDRWADFDAAEDRADRTSDRTWSR